MLNLHHLELFYHVARAGGISRAVKRIPYGIQQPAVSGQIVALERELGTRLFERSPFRLTAAGTELFAFVEPFFSGLASVESRLREHAAPVLRIGAAEVALRHHLPAVLVRVRAAHPGLRVSLRSGFQGEMETWLQERSIDVAVTPLERRPARGVRALPLLRVPLVLQVPRRSPVKAATDLWSQRRVAEPLVALPESEAATRAFRKGLARHGVRWPTALEASSLEAITAHVAAGGGIGLNVGIPEVVRHPRVRVLPLDDFPPLEIAALWRGEPAGAVAELLAVAKEYVRTAWPR